MWIIVEISVESTTKVANPLVFEGVNNLTSSLCSQKEREKTLERIYGSWHLFSQINLRAVS